MRTITLDELNRADAMMTRVDRKYLLNHAEAAQLHESLPADTRVLSINGVTSHRYDTTYYDTPGLQSYFSAVRKLRKRYKVRVRTYVETDMQFLEVKTKGPRGVTVKQRVPYEDDPIAAWEWANALLAHETSGLPADHAGFTAPQKLRPVLRNTYRRMTLSPPDQGRATIDRDLTWSNPHGKLIQGLDLVVVETKSGAVPSSIDQLLWELGHRPRRVSKFGCGMALLYPELPSNNWHRTLRRYFLRAS